VPEELVYNKSRYEHFPTLEKNQEDLKYINDFHNPKQRLQ
jgi:hypothetical protein